MKKILIYDIPTRLFHWLFAFSFVAAFVIVKTVDDESIVYSYHMLLGLFLAGLVILRLFWGLFGGPYARFSSFALNPSDMIKYAKDLLISKTKRYLGHNPASSWAAIFMFVCAIGLAITGTLMVRGGDKVILEEIHEILANSFLVLSIAHVLGLIFHTMRHKELIGLSMLNGRKEVCEEELASLNSHPTVESSQHSLAGVFFLVLALTWGASLWKSFDQNTGILNLGGFSLQLMEIEDEGESVGVSESGRQAEGDDSKLGAIEEDEDDE